MESSQDYLRRKYYEHQKIMDDPGTRGEYEKQMEEDRKNPSHWKIK